MMMDMFAEASKDEDLADELDALEGAADCDIMDAGMSMDMACAVPI